MRGLWWRRLRARLRGHRIVLVRDYEVDGTKVHDEITEFGDGTAVFDRWVTPPAAVEMITFVTPKDDD